MKDEHIGELVDLYVLGALEPEEQNAVDSHLDACVECRALVGDARRVVELLAWTPDQRTPPPDLERKVLRRVEQLQRTERAARSSPPRGRSRRWGLGWLWPRNGLIAAGLALLLLLVVWNVRLQQQVSALAEQAEKRQQLDQILGGLGVHVATLEPQPAAPQAWGSMVINPTGADGYLIVNGLPQLPRDKMYQLWLLQGNSRANGGVFRVDDRGAATMLVHAPAKLGTYNGCGITIEPDGGSPGPTGARVLRSVARDGGSW
jgi:anti-sigma-K factor RskA